MVLQDSTLRRAWNTFRDTASELGVATERIRAAAVVLQDSTLRRAWNSMVESVRAAGWRHGAASQVLGRMLHAQVARAFSQWSSSASASATSSRLASHALASFLNQTLAIGLRTWKETATLRAHAIALIRRVCMRELWQAATRWREAASAQSSAFDELHRAVCFMRHAELARAWSTFTAYASEYGQAMGEVEYATRAFLKLAAARAMRQWASAVSGLHAERAIRRTLFTLGAERLTVGWRAFRLALMARRREVAAFDKWANRADEHSERSAHRQALRERAVMRMLEAQLSRAYETWWAYASERVHALGLATNAVRCITNGQLARGLRTWVATADLIAGARTLIARVAHGRVYAAYAAWADFSSDRAHAHASAQRVLLRMMAQHLARGFNTFCAYVDARHARLEALRHVVGRLRNQSLARAYATWVGAYELRKRTVRLAAKSMLWTNTRYMRAGLRGWWAGRAVVKRHRAALRQWRQMCADGAIAEAARLDSMEVVCRKLRQLKLCKGFNTLVHVLAVERALLAAVQRLRHRGLSRAYAAWYGRVFEDIEAASAYEVAFRRLRQQGLARAYAQWAGATADAVHAREVLSQSVREMRISIFGRAMPRWQEYVTQLQRMRQAAARMRQAEFARGFGTWVDAVRGQVERNAQRTHVLSTLRHTKAAAAWRTWLEANEEAAERREQRAYVVGALRNVKAAAAWRTWLETIDAVAERRAQQAYVLSAMLNGKVAAGWRTWLEWVEAAVNGLAQRGRVIATFRLGKAAEAYRTWKACLVDRSAMRRVALHLTNIHLARAHRGWVDYVTELRHRARAAAGFRNRSSLSAWNSWVSFAEEQQTQRTFLARIVHADASRALRRWLEATEEAVETHRLLTHAVAGLLHAQSFRSFRTWAATAAALRRSYRTMRAAIEHSVTAALATWIDAVAQIRRQRGIASQLYDNALGKAMRTWLSYLDERSTMRSVTQQMRNRNLGAAMRTWLSYLDTSNATRDTMLSTALTMRHRFLAKAMRTWDSYLDERSTMRSVTQQMRNRNLGAAMRTWLSYLDTSNATRDTMLSTALTMRHRFLAKAMRTWDSYLDEREAMFNAALQLQNHMIGKVVRTWLSYLDESAARKDQVARAVGAMRSRGLFRAFRGWRVATPSRRRHTSAAVAAAVEAAAVTPRHSVDTAAVAAACAEATTSREAAMMGAAAAAAAAAHATAHAAIRAHSPPPAPTPRPLSPPPDQARLLAYDASKPSVVILSARPRTVMERGGEATPATFEPSLPIAPPTGTGGASGLGRPPWNAPLGSLIATRRGMAWDYEARNERAIAALDAGRLPSLRDVGGGRHVAARACAWGAKMSEPRRTSESIDLFASSASERFRPMEAGCLTAGSCRTSRVGRSLSFDSRSSRSAARHAARHSTVAMGLASSSLPRAAMISATTADYSSELRHAAAQPTCLVAPQMSAVGHAGEPPSTVLLQATRPQCGGTVALPGGGQVEYQGQADGTTEYRLSVKGTPS